MNYPKTRLRRLRYNHNIREMFEDVSIKKSDLIQPIFVTDGQNIKVEIKGLDEQFQLSIDNCINYCSELLELGLKNIILFGVSKLKDENGDIACSHNSIIPKAIKKIKEKFGDNLLVIADVCNCSYTNHGHCGTITDDEVDNDLTIQTLAKQSITLAESGADVIAPSDMMDGRVQLIRNELDKKGFEKIPIFPYSVKYASSFYGPFRNAVDSKPKRGDRKSYQMNHKNSVEFIREIEQDINEGADALIIKPALAYLDIIREVKVKFNVPIIAYNVSGEYSMVKAAAQKKHIDELEIILEIILSMKRAGADAIISYHSVEVVKYLNKTDV